MATTTFLLALFALVFTPQPQTNSSAPATVISPSHNIPTFVELPTQLPLAKDFRISAPMPNGDTIIAYDTIRDTPNSTDYLDNHPHIAILRHGKVIYDLDTLDADDDVPSIRALAISPLPDNQLLLSVAVTLGADRAASLFIFITEAAGQYKISGTVHGSIAQIRFKTNFSADFELWADMHVYPDENDVNQNCVWCPSEYRRTTYTWRHGQPHAVKSITDKHFYNPGGFFDAPFASIK